MLRRKTKKKKEHHRLRFISCIANLRERSHTNDSSTVAATRLRDTCPPSQHAGPEQGSISNISQKLFQARHVVLAPPTTVPQTGSLTVRNFRTRQSWSTPIGWAELRFQMVETSNVASLPASAAQEGCSMGPVGLVCSAEAYDV